MIHYLVVILSRYHIGELRSGDDSAESLNHETNSKHVLEARCHITIFQLRLNLKEVLDYELVEAIMSHVPRNQCEICHLGVLDAGIVFGKSWTKGTGLVLELSGKIGEKNSSDHTLAESFILVSVHPNRNQFEMRKIKSLDFVDADSRGINRREVMEMGISSFEWEPYGLHQYTPGYKVQ